MVGIELPERYEPRRIRFLELWEIEGWRLKVYGIAYHESEPRAEVIEAARELATGSLPRPAAGAQRYGVGFVGVHQGRGYDLVFVDWWANQNELFHRAFTRLQARGQRFRDAGRSGLLGCVWDLAVLGFERQAWIDAMLTDPGPDGLESYLETRLNGTI